MLNSRLASAPAYPFERKAKLFAELASRPVTADLTIGEPQHQPDPKVVEILHDFAPRSVGKYPPTRQESFLTSAIIEATIASTKLQGSILESQVLAGCGSGELLYSLATVCVDPSKPYVLIPNPAYQVYQAAAANAGGIPYFFNLTKSNNFQPDLSAIPTDILERTSLMYLNTPNNPCAVSYTAVTLREAATLARRYNFAIASDECYIDIYFGEKPPSILEICAALDGDTSFKNVVAFSSLSKRSSLPGLRSGAMIGDERIIRAYTRLRMCERKTLPFHVQRASAYAWTNLQDVANNRELYRRKAELVASTFERAAIPVTIPQSTFFLWLDISEQETNDEAFALSLARETGILTYPGSYFSRESGGENPGAGFLRIALVDTVEATAIALNDLASFIKHFRK